MVRLCSGASTKSPTPETANGTPDDPTVRLTLTLPVFFTVNDLVSKAAEARLSLENLMFRGATMNRGWEF
jgi:hypothetical protein